MKTISGTVNCKDTTEIPVGSVAFIHVFKGSEEVGHRTLPNLTSFPFEFKVELNDNELNESGYTLRVSIDNGENIIFLNEKGSTPIEASHQLDAFQVEVNKL